MKKLFALMLVCALMLCSCGRNTAEESGTDKPSDAPVPEGVFSDFDLECGEGPAPVFVKLSGTSAEIDGEGAALDGNVMKITMAGTYVLSGDFSGTVAVEAEKTDDVHLILDGASISSPDSAAIYGVCSDKIVITLAENTENTLSDGTSYFVNKGDEPNACIFSDDDLTVNGTGKLNVTGNCNNGIGSKNDLRIVSGDITVTAVKNALKGNDSVVIGGGTLVLGAGKDAVKSDNETEAERGYVSVYGGSITITAGDDGIQAVAAIEISGGHADITAADNALNCDGRLNVKNGCVTEK